jgi:TonB family protein
MPTWEVPYAPGRLEAVGYRGGREVARAAVETTGAPVALRLTPDRAAMAADGEDAQPFTVDAVDAGGRHVPTANLMVDFGISGGAIIGLGNGDPNSHNEEGDIHGIPEPVPPAVDGPVYLTPEMSRPRALQPILPRYTEPARRAGLQGTVIVEAIIDEQGRATNVRVIRGLPMGLDRSAVEAIQQVTFQPAMRGGRPVKVYFNLTVNFTISGR